MLPVALLSVLATLLVTAEGVPHERRENAPPGFVLTSPAPPMEAISFRIALAPQSFSSLEQTLYNVSTPGHAQYGKHLSQAEVHKFTDPATSTLEAITAWLSAHDLTQTRLTSGKSWLNVNITAVQAKSLFGANYSVFTHQETGEKVVRTLEYTIPQDLDGHVQVIHPGTSFPKHFKRLNPKATPPPLTGTSNVAPRASPKSCDHGIVPACLQDVYSIPTALAPSNKSRLVVTTYQDEYVSESDLQKYLQEYRPDLPSNTTFTLQTVAGGENPQDQPPGGEADLDMELAVGLASGIPVTLLATGDTNLLDPLGFINSVDALLAESDPPQVVTISYAWEETYSSLALTQTVCNAFAQLGARDVSIVVGSGDGGVSGVQFNASCSGNDPFIPVFPATCPYVTAVGSTGTDTNTGADFSAGGFSNYLPAPSYQSSSPYVSNYMKTVGSEYKGRYNAAGRAFPDVATIGVLVAIVGDGENLTLDGTSCSAPTFASIIALLNSELLAAGKSVLGFLNPLLWSGKFDGAFIDATEGNNPGCGTNGFSAAAGWDLITGFGSPNYAKMKAALGL